MENGVNYGDKTRIISEFVKLQILFEDPMNKREILTPYNTFKLISDISSGWNHKHNTKKNYNRSKHKPVFIGMKPLRLTFYKTIIRMSSYGTRNTKESNLLYKRF